MAQGSHAHVREVENEADTASASGPLATRLSRYADVHIKIVGAYPVPFRVKYTEGSPMSAMVARAANYAYVERAASVANSSITRGKQKDLSDADKAAWLQRYVNEEYKLTDDFASYLATNLLTMAADRVVFELGKSQKKWDGSFSDHDTASEREGRKATVAKILGDAALADKYQGQVEAMIATILGERHEVSKRTPKADGGVDIEL